MCRTENKIRSHSGGINEEIMSGDKDHCEAVVYLHDLRFAPSSRPGSRSQLCPFFQKH